jgi:hypothetical protein
MHASRARAGGALQERLTCERSISLRTGRSVRLHDGALRLRIFFKREGTHQNRYRFPRKVLNVVKKIERGDRGGKQLPEIFPGVGGFGIDD